MRVHLYERGFRQKPDRRVFVDRSRCGCDPRLRRRTPQCHGQSAVLPDDSDMHLGRERPLPTGPGTGSGGWQRGSLTPPMPRSLLLTVALTATRAAKSAARFAAAKSHTANNIAEFDAPPNQIDPAARWTASRASKRGNTAPSLCSPLFFFARALSYVCRVGRDRIRRSVIDRSRLLSWRP